MEIGGTSSPQRDTNSTNNTMQQHAQTLDAAMQSLPQYVLGDGQKKTSVYADISYMIAVHDSDRRDPAIVMTGELVDAIIASTSAGIEAIYQSDLAKQQRDVIMAYQHWKEHERDQALKRRQVIDNSQEQSARLRKLDRDLELAEQQKLEIDERTNAADREAFNADLTLVAILHETFENHALIDAHNERFENLRPDDEFLDRWKILETKEPSEVMDGAGGKGDDRKLRTPSPPPGGSRSSHRSSGTDGSRGRARELPRSRSSSPRRDTSRVRSPIRDRYRSISSRRERSGSLTPRASRTPDRPANSQQPPPNMSPQQSIPSQIGTPPRARTGRSRPDAYEVPIAEKARRKFYAYAEDLRKAQDDFDKRHEITQLAPHPLSEAEPRHPFEIFKELNRKQVEAEDRFRQARRRCNELGVDTLYPAQTSSFTQNDDGEQKERAIIAKFVGPEKYPQVQTWLDGVVVDAASTDLPDHQPSAHTEADEWTSRPWVDWDDCWSAVAVGVGGGHIQRDRTARDDLRQEVKEQRANALGISKNDWDARNWA